MTRRATVPATDSSEGCPSNGAREEADALAAMARAEYKTALGLLMDLYGESLHRFCAEKLGDVNQADDILQTVFIQAYDGLPSFARRSSLKTWLYSIARHRCLDEARRRRRWQQILRWPGRLPESAADVFDPEEAGGPWEPSETESRSLSEHLENCLNRLSTKLRESLILRYRHSLPYEEIADVTGARAGTVRVRVLRGLPLLRRCLERKGVVL
jgi:RNA polymerase sigma-70 factor (ECF subfamily)